MSAKTTDKRPVRASAVVGIVIWSVVFCLLGGLLAAGLNGTGFRILDIGGVPVFSFGGFAYENASAYSVGDAVTDEAVTELSIHWLAGQVTVTASEDDRIHITEDYDGAKDNLRLRWMVEEGELTVQFRKPALFGDTEALRKNLTVALPAAMLEALDEVEIDVVDGDVHFTGNADELNVETVQGSVTVNGNIGELTVQAVDGRVSFDGAVRSADIEGVRTDVTMHLDMAASLHFDQIDGDVTLCLSEEITGFTAEMDSLSGQMNTEGFDGLKETGDSRTRWGDGSLRISVDGLQTKLLIKKTTES